MAGKADDPIKEVTAYQAWCPTGDGWKSNVCVSAEDAQLSLDAHAAEEHPPEVALEETS